MRILIASLALLPTVAAAQCLEDTPLLPEAPDGWRIDNVVTEGLDGEVQQVGIYTHPDRNGSAQLFFLYMEDANGWFADQTNPDDSLTPMILGEGPLGYPFVDMTGAKDFAQGNTAFGDWTFGSSIPEDVRTMFIDAAIRCAVAAGQQLPGYTLPD